MKFNEPVVFGTLLKRYKRFFSEVKLDSGEVVVAHTPNTGPMTSCWGEGWKCVLTKHDDPKRKLQYTLQLTYHNGTYIVVNTHLANRLVKEALSEKIIREFKDIEQITPEYKVGRSRFDFLLQQKQLKVLLEVKSATSLDAEGVCIFPDTRSERALKHIEELTTLCRQGYECYLLFVVARQDCQMFRPAKEIMPDYFEAIQGAVAEGVRVLTYQCQVSPEEIKLSQPLPVDLS